MASIQGSAAHLTGQLPVSVVGHQQTIVMDCDRSRPPGREAHLHANPPQGLAREAPQQACEQDPPQGPFPVACPDLALPIYLRQR